MKNLSTDIKSNVELVPGKGTKRYGGTVGGQYWHVYCNKVRAGRVFINLIECENGSKFASITVHLNQKHRGLGIGILVFKRACELSQYNQIYAEMRKRNIAARKSAERAGFEILSAHKGEQIKMIWNRDRFLGL